MIFKRWIILYQNDIYRNEVYETKKVARELAKEYLNRDYKLIEVKIYKKSK